ncbi:MAG: thioredoxin family protein [Patescibacteria group bacterium]
MPLIIAIVALVAVVGGVSYFAKSPNKDAAMMEKEGDTMMKKDGEAMMVKYTGTVLAGNRAPLIDYNKADYDTAIASDKLVVLYFYANWCPVCKDEVLNALIPAFNELTTDKVVGIRISYKDSETDSDEKALAVKFGIPYQHTKVFIKNGKQILKAPDGWNKARYTTEINKALAQ